MSTRSAKEILEAQIAALDVLLEKNRNTLEPALAASLNAGLQLQRQNLLVALETGTLNSPSPTDDPIVPSQSNTDEAEEDENVPVTTLLTQPTQKKATKKKKNMSETDSYDGDSDSSDVSSIDSSSSEDQRRSKKKKKKNRMRKRIKKLRRKGQKYEETYEHKPLLSTIMPSDVISFLREFDGWERKLKHHFKLKKADLMICIHHTVLEQLNIMQVDTEHDETIREYLNSIRNEFEEERKQTLFDRISLIHYNANTGSLLASTQTHIMRIEEEIANLELGYDAEKRLCKLVLETMPAIFLKGNLKNMMEQRSLTTWPALKSFLLTSSKMIAQFDWTLIDLRTRKQVKDGAPRVYPSGSGKVNKSNRSKKTTNKSDVEKQNNNANQNNSNYLDQAKSPSNTALKGYKSTRMSLEQAQKKLKEMKHSEGYSDVLKAQLIDCFMKGLCTKCRSNGHPSSGCLEGKEKAIALRREYYSKNQLDINNLLKGCEKSQAKSVNQIKSNGNTLIVDSDNLDNKTSLQQAASDLKLGRSANMIKVKEKNIENLPQPTYKENIKYWMQQSEELKAEQDAYNNKNLHGNPVRGEKIETKSVSKCSAEYEKNESFEHLIMEDDNGIIWRNYKTITPELLWNNQKPVVNIASKEYDQPPETNVNSTQSTLESYDENWELGYGENTLSDYEDLAKQNVTEEEEIKDAIRKQLNEAGSQGILRPKEVEALQDLYFRYLPAFGIRQSIAQMSSLPPMPVIQKPDAKPFRAPARDLNRVKKEAMRTKIKDLVSMGMLKHEPNPLYSSPAFMVPKKGNKWRMVIDLRELNEMVEVSGASLVDLEAQLNWLPQNINYIASLDALSGFDMLPISKDAEKYFNISTPFGCYRLLGSPMGLINTPFVYSTRMISYILGGHNGVFGTPNQGCLQWLDDSLVYSQTFEGFISVLETILKNCLKYKLRLNANKCIFITQSTEWCGRTISKEGWNFSTKHFNKILKMNSPRTLGQLEDILYVSSWLAPAIPKLSTLKTQLQNLATDLKKKLFLDRGKRVPKRFRSKMNIVEAVQYPTLQRAFENFKSLIAASAKITLQHIDSEQQLEVYTDASDTQWAAVITILKEEKTSIQDTLNCQNEKNKDKVETSDQDPAKEDDEDSNYDAEDIDISKSFEYENNFSFAILKEVMARIEQDPVPVNTKKLIASEKKHQINLAEDNKIHLISKSRLDSIQKWRGRVAIENTPRVYLNDAIDCLDDYYQKKLTKKKTLEILSLIKDSIDGYQKLFRETINLVNEKPLDEITYEYLKKQLIRGSKENIAFLAESKPEKFRLTDNQIVRPVYFLSGTFKGPELSWSVSEKEMVPIIKALLWFEYLTCGTVKPIRILTDHRNLIYIFSPPKTVKTSSLSRLQRWAIMLQKFNMEVLHYSGEHNRFADLLSRWGFPVEVMDKPTTIQRNYDANGNMRFGKITLKAHAVTTRFKNKYTNPLDLEKEPQEEIQDEREDDPEWFQWRDCRISFLHPAYENKWERITVGDVKCHQSNLENKDQYNLTKGLYLKEGKIVIPTTLLPRLLFHTHVAEGHTSVDAEPFDLEKFYFTIPKTTLRKYLKRIHTLCLHCDKFPSLVRRPIGRLPHATRPNILLHTDYISIYNGYLLSIVDDFSRKTWLFYRRYCSVEGYVEGITSWAAILGLSGRAVIASDKGSHFCNQVAKELDKQMGYSRRLSIVYSPWSNGPVERRNREILRMFRSLTSELGLPLNKWSILLNRVMGHINNHPIKAKKYLTPNQIYSGRNIDGKIISIDPELSEPLINTDIENPVIPIWDQEKFIQFEDENFFKNHMEELIQELNTNDETLQHYLLSERDRHQKKFNKNLHPDHIQYGVGDFVMYSIAGTSLIKDKLQLRWLGPAVIEDIIGNNLYLLKDLLGNQMEVHSRRIKFYDGKEHPITEDIKEVYLYNSGRFQLEKILDMQEIENRAYLKVKWRGLDALDSDWQPFDTLWVDAKYSIIKYLEKHKENSPLARSLYKEYVIPYRRERTARLVYITKHPENLSLVGDQVLPYLAQSKGWSEYEDLLLKRSIRCFGFGEWDKILKSYILPGKTRAQIIDRAKTLVGSQSIFQYHGLFIDVDIIKQDNDRKIVHRKNGVIINKGKHLTRIQRKIQKNKTYDEYKGKQEPLKPSEIGIPKWDCIKNNKLTHSYKQELYSFWRNKVFAIESTANVIEPKYFLQVKLEGQLYIEVHGLLDSGASVTCMDRKQWPEELRNCIIRNDKYHKKYKYLFDANGRATSTEGYVESHLLLQLNCGEIEIPKVKIMLMQSSGWKYLLLGSDVLQRLRIMPEYLLNTKLQEINKAKELENTIMQIRKSATLEIEYDKTDFLNQLNADLRKENEILNQREVFKKNNSTLIKALIHFHYENYEKNKLNFLYNGVECILKKKLGNTYELAFQEKVFEIFIAPKYSTYIQADVLSSKCYDALENMKFKALIVDPPWTQSGTSPTRGVTIPFGCLTDDQLLNIPLEKFLPQGYLFLWVVANKTDVAKEWIKKSGFRFLDYMVWDKRTINGKGFSSQGKYLRHRKELCILAKRGMEEDDWRKQKQPDLFMGKVTEPMRKPVEFYTIVEECLPGGLYLELFGRTHNLRDYWTTVGNEIDPTPDKEMLEMFKPYGFNHLKGERYNDDILFA
eukprot:augustus_masked-scaffold_46-processed-gene-0.9-mRNA-1 protein AED:0.36 eAED:0.36 QI:0/-1/0/1/-1/1/1/0/2648